MLNCSWTCTTNIRQSRMFVNLEHFLIRNIRSLFRSFVSSFVRLWIMNDFERSNKRSWIVFLNYWIWNEEPFRACKCTHEGRANDMKMESGQMHVLLSERTNELTTEWVYKCTHERACKCTYRLACKCMHKWPRDSLGRLYLSVCRHLSICHGQV